MVYVYCMYTAFYMYSVYIYVCIVYIYYVYSVFICNIIILLLTINLYQAMWLLYQCSSRINTNISCYILYYIYISYISMIGKIVSSIVCFADPSFDYCHAILGQSACIGVK